MPRWFTGPQTVTHDTNRVWRSATTLIEANALPLSQTVNHVCCSANERQIEDTVDRTISSWMTKSKVTYTDVSRHDDLHNARLIDIRRPQASPKTRLIERRNTRHSVDRTSAYTWSDGLARRIWRGRQGDRNQSEPPSYHAARADSSVRVWASVVGAYSPGDLITISWQRTGRLNKNITCLVSADPESSSHGRLSVHAGFAVQKWSGMDRRPTRFHLVAEASTPPFRAPAAGGAMGGACAVAGRRLVGHVRRA